MLPVGHSELIDGEPVVVVWRVEIYHPGLRACDGTIGTAILDRYAIHQHFMNGAVAFDERRRIAASEFAERVLNRIERQLWIQL